MSCTLEIRNLEMGGSGRSSVFVTALRAVEWQSASEKHTQQASRCTRAIATGRIVVVQPYLRHGCVKK